MQVSSTPSGTFYRSTGEYVYSLGDHLGNVRAVVPRIETASLQATLNWLKFFSDYYPIGLGLPGRPEHINVGYYRYGYQGQEKDPETNWYAFRMRMYDGRIGRWMTTDPAWQYYSLYMAMGNNPTGMVDKDGGVALLVVTAGIGAVIGFGIGVGMAYLNGEDFSSDKTWRTIGPSTAAGAFVGGVGVYSVGLGIGAEIAAAASSDILKQKLIDNKSAIDWADVWISTALAGMGASIGGSIG